MIRSSFNHGWTVAPKQSLFAAVAAPAAQAAVVLPHDALRTAARSSASPNGSHTGYFPSAHVVYEKVFDAPLEWADRSVVVEFEGVYRDAVVTLNGDLVAQRPSGYSPFEADLTAGIRIGSANTIRVEARTHQDSRWYSGVGIHRDVRIGIAGPVHVPFGGLHVTTPKIEDDLAIVDFEVEVRNTGLRTEVVRARSRVLDSRGQVLAQSTTPVTIAPGEPALVRLRHYVSDPRRWDVDDPQLHRAEVELIGAVGDTLDVADATFGIRTIQIDPVHGFRLNGHTVQLRGGCVHHDNGLLGAASIDRAEQRKAEILKGSGFNAVRSAHNPASRAFLEACDRVGLLVIDELTDVWTTGKTSHDSSLAFPEWWERDVEALVRNGRNHPSVIMYSIGNEILEVGRPGAAIWGRRLAAKVRSLDPSRFLTNAVNGLVSVLDARVSAHDDAVTFDFNEVLSSDGPGLIGASELVTQRTEETHAQVDVAGINYSEARYDLDADRFPERVLVGTESFPSRLDHLWRLVEAHPQVVGDFAWTAWDHLGEAGTGRAVYADDPGQPVGMASPYPWLLSQAGTIDINGIRRPISHWRERVWGLTNEPYLAVHRPQRYGRELVVGRWAWDDVLATWAWDVPDASPVVVDVYADADEVELFLDGISLGTAPVGITVGTQQRDCIARFETEYHSGVLSAVARRGGREVGRAELRSLRGDVGIAVNAERRCIDADSADLAYVHVELIDAEGTLAVDAAAEVTLTINGPGDLIGMSGAKPDDEQPFGGATHRTHEGRLLAVVRPTGPGEIRVEATSEFGAAAVVIVAAEPEE